MLRPAQVFGNDAADRSYATSRVLAPRYIMPVHYPAGAIVENMPRALPSGAMKFAETFRKLNHPTTVRTDIAQPNKSEGENHANPRRNPLRIRSRNDQHSQNARTRARRQTRLGSPREIHEDGTPRRPRR